MPVPRIAVVGRPNVGKSSLLNMIARDKVSIVDPTAGTTRDRVSIVARLSPPDENMDSARTRTVEVTDTGGFGVYVADGKRYDEVGADLSRLTGDIEHQISEAVKSADLVLFVIDTQQGITALDEKVAQLLRERVLGGKGTKAARAREGAGETASTREKGPEIRIVANKCDGPRWEAHAYEAAALGFGEPMIVSAKNNYFRREFLDELYRAVDALPGISQAGKEGVEHSEAKIAIIGKRNAGKSSLVNALAGQERVIVSEIAGTTRDAVDVKFELDGRSFVAIDTAGLRKKKSFQDQIEHFAFDRATRSIDRADVVLLLVDATVPISQVDQQLAMLCQSRHKPVMIVVNKWDLVEGTIARAGKFRGEKIGPENYEEYLRGEFKGVPYAPISFISAQRKLNLEGTIKTALELVEQSDMRVGTGKLNRVLKRVLATRGPSSKLGTFAKAYFIAQVATRPPTVVLVVNKPELFTANYQKFLLNRIREQVPFSEVPIKLVVRGRTTARAEDLVEGERQLLREQGARVVDAALADADLGDDAAKYFEEEAASGPSAGRAHGPQPGHVPDSGKNRHLLAELGLDEDDLDDDGEPSEAGAAPAIAPSPAEVEAWFDADDDEVDGENGESPEEAAPTREQPKPAAKTGKAAKPAKREGPKKAAAAGSSRKSAQSKTGGAGAKGAARSKVGAAKGAKPAAKTDRRGPGKEAARKLPSGKAGMVSKAGSKSAGRAPARGAGKAQATRGKAARK